VRSCCYDNDEANGKQYGRLYTWNAARLACPAGWHLPTRREWDTLLKYVGGWKRAGKKLKSTSGWSDYKGVNGNGTDDYGFSALPSGERWDSTGEFCSAGHGGYWWTATESFSCLVYSVRMSCVGDQAYNLDDGGDPSYSVRCVQDS